MPTLVELHYDPNHQGLKQFLAIAAATAKANPNGAKFVTYAPVVEVPGTAPENNVIYLFFRNENHGSALNDALGAAAATKLAQDAKGGVKAVAQVSYEVAESQGNKAPAPYLLVVGLDPAANKDANVVEAFNAVRDANSRSASPVGYHVLKSGSGGPTLLALPLQSLADLDNDGALNQPHLQTFAGPQAAQHAQALRRVGHTRTLLAYVPGSSNP